MINTLPISQNYFIQMMNCKKKKKKKKKLLFLFFFSKRKPGILVLINDAGYIL